MRFGRRRSTTVLTVLLTVSSAILVMAQEPARASSSTVDPATRPKIGLALAGGVARGGAHIGVLEVLEELRIPVDYVRPS